MAQLRQDDRELTFAQTDAEARPWLPVAVAGAIIAIVVAVLIAFAGHRTPTTVAGPGLAAADPYAANLAIANVHMSEASNFAGGKVTYVDGDITNQGTKTLSGVTVQVAFHNEYKEIAQKETMPLSLIRTHEPYVDTEPVSADPLKPGDHKEFRLIFDSVAPDWNQQYPEIRVIQISSK